MCGIIEGRWTSPALAVCLYKPQFLSRLGLDLTGYKGLGVQQAVRVGARAAAVASTRRAGKGKARQKDRYVDDPEEEDTLLGGQYDEVESSNAPPSTTLQKSPTASLKSRNEKDKSRTIPFRLPDKLQSRFPPNIVRNQKYNAFTFLPIVLYEQFKFFFNLYFLLVALSQFVPALKIGFIFTYIAPLAFVLFVTLGKEAYNNYKRNLRDNTSSSKVTTSPPVRMTHHSAITRAIPSSSIRVGDLIVLEKNQRVPADVVLLRTSDSSGTCFIRTDQLDGETDWKLRVAVPSCQKLGDDKRLLTLDAEIYGMSPS
ncbi:putative aminophospholipid-translocase [Pleurotus ostreatus]|uniref:Putative aminophospholipid-translocase n=1 Tax=Pleurotus ostreatus TaxID=5322 RepID=A0A8H6ZLT9_PLEOS|nr:putative aminophospholipid-translocase [Pleurotus ostreatus]KAF7420938.1 putative aminophospholipid-translocase [Pleurotus ostreatus]